ncbi:MAG: hypothetical protein U5L04_06470, partial [Trueperaceae bacterium]|nr:hypothetical protein [Trueperaceae bacterium]
YHRKIKNIEIKTGSNLRVSEELKPQVVELNQVEVVSSNKEWQNDYAFFKKQFLGDSDFADLSTIENPWVIDFEDTDNGKLAASASEPLIVENRGLGYILYIELVNFEWSTRGGGGSYLIYPRYESLEPESAAEEKSWHINRAKNYYGSLRHFLKNLFRNRLDDKPFYIDKVRNIEPLTKGQTLFRLRQMGGIPRGRLGDYKGYRLYRETDITYNYPAFVAFQGDTTKVLINKNAQIEPNTNSELFFIDRKGNLLDPTSVTLFGTWAKNRVAHTLPDDYLPGN